MTEMWLSVRFTAPLWRFKMVEEENGGNIDSVANKYNLSGKKLSQDEIDKIVKGYAKGDKK